MIHGYYSKKSRINAKENKDDLKYRSDKMHDAITNVMGVVRRHAEEFCQ